MSHYYRTCPHCGAHLDPGENCDCVHSEYACLNPENRKLVNRTVAELLSKQRAALETGGRPTGDSAGGNNLAQVRKRPFLPFLADEAAGAY